MVSNPRVLAIAVFASLGGFVYGCMYRHYEYHPPKVYTLMYQSRRQPGHVWSNPEHVLFFGNRAPGVNQEPGLSRTFDSVSSAIPCYTLLFLY